MVPRTSGHKLPRTSGSRYKNEDFEKAKSRVFRGSGVDLGCLFLNCVHDFQTLEIKTFFFQNMFLKM